MAYSELIKDFARIRDYMREFFVFGFKSRDEYSLKSARSYDNERRRIESWLGEYMSFRQTETGKNVFLSVDSRDMVQNPLFQAFRARSFTDRDIVLYYYVMDILGDGGLVLRTENPETDRSFSVPELMEAMEERYFRRFAKDQSFDLSTLRKKMKEFEELGLVCSEKTGNKVRYRLAGEVLGDASCVKSVGDDEMDSDVSSEAKGRSLADSLREAVSFFSEEVPMGVIGSYILDMLSDRIEWKRDKTPMVSVSHKHHYILDALDSKVLLQLVSAMSGKQSVTVTSVSRRGKTSVMRFCPLKIYVSTRQGRWHIYGYQYDRDSFDVLRVDSIRKVETGDAEPRYDGYLRRFEKEQRHLWGVSGNRFGGTSGIRKGIVSGKHTINASEQLLGEDVDNRSVGLSGRQAVRTQHVEMDVFVGEKEDFIVGRLFREKRCGEVYQVDEHTWRYSADVADTLEMLPWVRTFTGRILRLVSTGGELEEKFYLDLGEMYRMYREDKDGRPDSSGDAAGMQEGYAGQGKEGGAADAFS